MVVINTKFGEVEIIQVQLLDSSGWVGIRLCVDFQHNGLIHEASSKFNNDALWRRSQMINNSSDELLIIETMDNIKKTVEDHLLQIHF